jgi:hypothetical protein
MVGAVIRGLTWANIGWIALSLVLLTMVASADGAYKLNWKIAVNIWNQVSSGGQGLWKAQGEAARKLDAATQRRYGYDPIEPRAASCVTSPNYSAALQVQDLTKLREAKGRDAIVLAIGEPFCKVASGSEIWLVGAAKYLEFDPKAKTYQLKSTSQAQNSEPK